MPLDKLYELVPLFVSLSACRQFVFAAFTEEFLSAPFTEQIFHFFIPALSDVRRSFPFEAFLSSQQGSGSGSGRSSSASQSKAPWVFYFVLSAGENRLGGSHTLGPSNVSLIPLWARECVFMNINSRTDL